MTTADRYVELGRLVEERRRELGLTRDDVRALGGPSQATLLKIEQGKAERRRIDVTWPLERMLGWRPGAFSAFLENGKVPDVATNPDYSSLRSSEKRSVKRPQEEAADLHTVATEDLLAELARRTGSGTT